MMFWKEKKVLVTGHTGFKGSWLSKLLLTLGANVIGYSLEPPTTPNMFTILQLKDKIRHQLGDIRNYDSLQIIDMPKYSFYLPGFN